MGPVLSLKQRLLLGFSTKRLIVSFVGATTGGIQKGKQVGPNSQHSIMTYLSRHFGEGAANAEMGN